MSTAMYVAKFEKCVHSGILDLFLGVHSGIFVSFLFAWFNNFTDQCIIKNTLHLIWMHIAQNSRWLRSIFPYIEIFYDTAMYTFWTVINPIFLALSGEDSALSS